jgi:hypothetical protein
MSIAQMAQLKKRGILVWVHETSYRFFFFWFIGKNGLHPSVV